MKIIITEEMLANIVLNEAFDPDVARIDAMKKRAEDNYYAKNPNVYNKSLRSNPKMASNNNDSIGSLLKGLFQNQSKAQQGALDVKQIGNLGDWNVGKSVQYIMTHASAKSNGKCATHVEDAIAAGGLPRMTCRMNGGDGYAHSLHYKGTLQQYGFKVIDSGTLQGNTKYGGQLQPGDIMVSDTYRYSKNPYKNHIAMWTGSQWVSDFTQNNANVYKYPADFWIYRYTGGQK